MLNHVGLLVNGPAPRACPLSSLPIRGRSTRTRPHPLVIIMRLRAEKASKFLGSCDNPSRRTKFPAGCRPADDCGAVGTCKQWSGKPLACDLRNGQAGIGEGDPRHHARTGLFSNMEPVLGQQVSSGGPGVFRGAAICWIPAPRNCPGSHAEGSRLTRRAPKRCSR
jgi:hypothetical protein